jgi:hypothetical protein
MKYTDIFVPGGFPHYTYYPRPNLQLEERLKEVKENLCKLVTVTGHTKSGKTVLTRRVLTREEAIWVDGGTVSEENDFWGIVIEQLDLFQTTEQQSEEATNSTVGAKAKAGASFFGVGGEAEANTEIEKQRSTSLVVSRSIPPRVTALNGLRESNIPIVIDDFHYLPKELQGSIVRALKPLIFDGLPVVIIAIPHRRYDAMKVEREMTGRIFPINVPAWEIDELVHIPSIGFGLLNIEINSVLPIVLANEAIGSPHLMQDFCRAICRQNKLPEPLGIKDHRLFMTDVFSEVAETIGRPIFEKLAQGPRQRTDRVPRKLKNGIIVDIYELVLHALAHLKPGLISLEYEELRAAIRDVSESAIPQMHEVARVLKHMATIAATDQSSTPVIDFEDEDKKLHITDPFFAFYLRWGEING